MIKINVCGVELTFEPREVILPEYGSVVLKLMEKENLPRVKKAILESMNRSPEQKEVSEKMLRSDLERWKYNEESYLFLIGSDTKNNVLGVTNGNVLELGDEICGQSIRTLNTSGAKGVGIELFKAKLEALFSSKEIEIVYADPLRGSRKGKKMLEYFGFDPTPRGKHYKLFLTCRIFLCGDWGEPYSLTREYYMKLKK